MSKRKKVILYLTTILSVFFAVSSFFYFPSNDNITKSAPIQKEWIVNEQGYTDGYRPTTESFDINWDLEFSNCEAYPPNYNAERGIIKFNTRRANGNGNELLVKPTSSNQNFVLKEFKLTTLRGYITDIKVWAGNDLNALSEIEEPKFYGVHYNNVNAGGVKYLKFKNVHQGAYDNMQIRISKITITYEEQVSSTNPVSSVDVSNYEGYTMARGQMLNILPTILPIDSDQGFTLTTDNPNVIVSGTQLYAAKVASNVTVTLTTSGLDINNQHLITTFTINVIQLTTTVEEALTLTPGNGIIYSVNNAVVRDDPNNNYNKIKIQTSYSATSSIVILSPDINPTNSYRFVDGGIISFEASIEVHLNINRFIYFKLHSYTDKAETFASDIMCSNTENQCLTLYSIYKAKINEMTSGELAKLKYATEVNGIDISTGRARYEAWARHLGDIDPYGDGTPISLSISSTSNNRSNIILIIFAILGFSLLICYHIFVEKKSKTSI